MANAHPNVIHRISTNQSFRQLQLFSLISRLCAPREDIPKSDVVRLIVDSRIPWAVEPVDGNSSWLYVPQAAHARQLAGCIVLTAD
jgi:hypothetical protein